MDILIPDISLRKQYTYAYMRWLKTGKKLETFLLNINELHIDNLIKTDVLTHFFVWIGLFPIYGLSGLTVIISMLCWLVLIITMFCRYF